MNQSIAIDVENKILRTDVQVISLVGLAHGISHFSHLILPSLFPWLKIEFNLSYSQLGLLMTIFFVVSGSGQALAGFVVDRNGARPVLLAGIAVLALAVLGLVVAPNYYALLFFSGLIGLGNSIFHPADFTLLNKLVSKPRLGHAFSAHNVSGFLGWALAPLFITTIATAFNWRSALFSAALLIALALLVVWSFRDRLAFVAEHSIIAHETSEPTNALAFLRLPLVWMCFGFFLTLSIAFAGIQSFASLSLQQIYNIAPTLATSSITVYMLASAAGTILGGFLAGKAVHQEKIISGAFAVAGALSFVVASQIVPAFAVIGLIGIIGFGAGIAGPSRDLLVRGASPKNATGRVYGVVYSGMDAGQALGPIIFGALMDAHHAPWVFIAIGLFQILAVFTAAGVGGKTAHATT